MHVEMDINKRFQVPTYHPIHPKKRTSSHHTSDCVYEIHCLNCHKSYIGGIFHLSRTSLFGTRLKEHKTEADKASDVIKLDPNGKLLYPRKINLL